MGEFIAEMQERLLPEYEQMKNFQIFTPEQIRECVRKRERLLLNVTKSQISIADYLDFIVYETQMHATITEKEKVSGMKLRGLKTSIATRIIRMYREMLVKFAHEKRLWNNFIKFSKKSAPQEVAGIYEKMLSYHGGDPETWTSAALWLYEYSRLNVTRAESLLLRGLQRHPSSELINKVFFDILLKEAQQADSKRTLADNTISEQDIRLERVMAVYKNSLNHITHWDYFLKLLEVCEDYPEMTVDLQGAIIDDMQTKFSRKPALWDALAKRELRGFHLADLNDYMKSKNNDDANGEPSEKKSRVQTDNNDDENIDEQTGRRRVWKTRTKKSCIEMCVQIYKSAVQYTATPEMWNLYLETMLSLSRNHKTERNLIQQCLANALQDGHNSKLMDAKHYATLSMILGNSDSGGDACVRILTEALEFDQSLRMHELLMAALIRIDDEPNVHKLFGQVRRTLGAAALPIWQSCISYYRARGDAQSRRRLNDIYTLACKETWPEFVALRCSYLRYLWHEHSPTKARDEYAKLALQPPMSVQLHREMIELLESTELRDLPTIKSWRMCYEFMATYFGKTEPVVWVDYLTFERDYGETKNISLLCQRARSTLEANLVPEFEEKRALAYIGAVI
ncbi:U3 small nucleolar RNA-associated protein 6 homolog [Drosophila albomicans]|uniref:U3 small nucleolar RNA-associated protein 6 homolog n=1 Tax=Drosophila albomicans TaxID=7291 RepID=A0A6P8XD87_DROAB|nr:U3 small nucleolar RNA-associated protein 6 homolog [Drosophila albomicans]